MVVPPPLTTPKTSIEVVVPAAKIESPAGRFSAEEKRTVTASPSLPKKSPVIVSVIGVMAGMQASENDVIEGALNVITKDGPALESSRTPLSRITSTVASTLATPQMTTAGVVPQTRLSLITSPTTSCVAEEPATHGVAIPSPVKVAVGVRRV